MQTIETIENEAVELTVMQRIRRGELDEQLLAIEQQVYARRELLAARKIAKLETGDVVFLQGMSPKYVNGMRATVVDAHVYRGGKRRVLVNVPGLVGTRYRQDVRCRPENLRAA